MRERTDAGKILDEMIVLAEEMQAPIILGRGISNATGAAGRIFTVGSSHTFPREFTGDVMGPLHQALVAAIREEAESEASRAEGRIWRAQVGPDIWFWSKRTQAKPD